MIKHIIISETSIETDPQLTLEELCLACGVSREFIQELIEYGVLELDDVEPESYRFDPVELRRIRTIVNLQSDLELNLPGAALVVDLMEELDEMRTRVTMLEKHIVITHK